MPVIRGLVDLSRFAWRDFQARPEAGIGQEEAMPETETLCHVLVKGIRKSGGEPKHILTGMAVLKRRVRRQAAPETVSVRQAIDIG
ncbi:hypothetical protein GCM10027040_17130 [Halomonas shantousis]